MKRSEMSDIVYPCPCDDFGDPIKPSTCSSSTITRYQKRISGPLLDRIDIHIEVLRVDNNNLSDHRLGEPSEIILIGVEVAREHQRRWFGVYDQQCEIDDGCPALQENEDRLPKVTWNSALLRENAWSKVSARMPRHVHKFAGTIIDRASCDKIESLHTAESWHYCQCSN